MKIKYKLLMIIAFLWLAISVAGYLLSFKIIGDHFLKLENDRIKLNALRVTKAINQVQDGLFAITSNWSVFDDMYQYAIDRNDQFIKSNVSVPILSQSGINLYESYNKSGDELFHIEIDRNGNIVNDSQAILGNSKDYNYIIHPITDESIYKGILKVHDNYINFAARSVLRSDGTGPTTGLLFLGEYIDNAVISTIEKSINLEFTINKISDINLLLQSIPKANTTLLNNLVVSRSHEFLHIYTPILDVRNMIIGYFDISMTRNLYNSGIETINRFNIIMIILSIASGLLIYVVISKAVTERFFQLTSQVNLRDQNELYLTTSISGSDEIYTLSTNINELVKQVNLNTIQNNKLLDELHSNTEIVKKNHAALKNSTDFLEEIFNILKIHIFVYRDKNSIHYIDKNTLNIIGKPLDSNRKLSEFISGNNEIDNVTAKLYDNDQNENYYINTYHDADRDTYYELIGYPIQSDDANYGVIIAKDITDNVLQDRRIIAAEKLASMGVLVSGLSTDLSEQIKLMSKDLRSINDYSTKYFEYLDLLNNYKDSQLTFSDLTSRLSNSNLAGEMNNLSASITDLCNKSKTIAAIVKNLQLFSRADEKSMKYHNINESIDLSLAILKNKLKDISVKKNLVSNTQIFCYPGQINQTILSILSYIIDSLDEHGQISIDSEQSKNYTVDLVISYQNGKLNAKIPKHIFEPGFSLSEEDFKKTSLSICKNVIEEHHGNIDLVEHNGIYQFNISLPVSSKSFT